MSLKFKSCISPEAVPPLPALTNKDMDIVSEEQSKSRSMCFFFSFISRNKYFRAWTGEYQIKIDIYQVWSLVYFLLNFFVSIWINKSWIIEPSGENIMLQTYRLFRILKSLDTSRVGSFALGSVTYEHVPDQAQSAYLVSIYFIVTSSVHLEKWDFFKVHLFEVT